ncbi:hypothetical protein TGFOU_219570 [Toxoplasma gondii FOU]|uniref:Uncharacterized protein n=2 Tax=Toxoplasma gondii TaxID=5811 RepID=A0A086L2Z8_TOXGO|nr:hypothetical protein TGFOU_219570 [Toxoplasma gondii FOU]PUA88837.1 hypothetical protein TGBR9_219570 [Toxoplasma gondii TgCATBr9]
MFVPVSDNLRGTPIQQRCMNTNLGCFEKSCHESMSSFFLTLVLNKLLPCCRSLAIGGQASEARAVSHTVNWDLLVSKEYYLLWADNFSCELGRAEWMAMGETHGESVGCSRSRRSPKPFPVFFWAASSPLERTRGWSKRRSSLVLSFCLAYIPLRTASCFQQRAAATSRILLFLP